MIPTPQITPNQRTIAGIITSNCVDMMEIPKFIRDFSLKALQLRKNLLRSKKSWEKSILDGWCQQDPMQVIWGDI